MLLYFASVFIFSIASFTSSHTVSPGVVYIALDSIIYNASSRAHTCCTAHGVARLGLSLEPNPTKSSYFERLILPLRTFPAFS